METTDTSSETASPAPSAFDNRNIPGIFVLSPTATTTPGKWTGFVCRVKFSATQTEVLLPDPDDKKKRSVKVRIRGGCRVLKAQTKPRLTSALLVTDVDVPAIVQNSSGISFGTGREANRGDEDIDYEFEIPDDSNEHFVDFLFMDADQNVVGGGVATQVWGRIEYVGRWGSDFTVDYTHGYDNSGNDSTTKWTVRPSGVLVEYIGGANRENGLEETLLGLTGRFLPGSARFLNVLKGYILKLTAREAIAGTAVAWNINGGSFYPSNRWTDYNNAPLTTAPQTRTIYWRSPPNGAIAQDFNVIADFYSQDIVKNVDLKTYLKTDEIRPGEAETAKSEEVIMLHRIMFQVFYIVKGELALYRSEWYCAAGSEVAAYYQYGTRRRFFSPVAEEVQNFKKGVLYQQGPTKNADATFIQALWNEFGLIAQAGVLGVITAADTRYDDWIDAAVASASLNVTGLVDSSGNPISPESVLKKLVKQESQSTGAPEGRHTWPLVGSLPYSNVDIGWDKRRGPTNTEHQLTDGGIGFAKVQPYNRAGLNIYNPDENLIRAATILQGRNSHAGNPGTNVATKLWAAFYSYNAGTSTFPNETPGQLRAAGGRGAKYADSIFGFLNIALPEIW